MKTDQQILHSVRLFDGIDEKDLSAMLCCLGAQQQTVKKNACVLAAGSKVEHVGIVLEGRFLIVREEIDGARSLLSTLTPGNFFGEALCCARAPESPVSVLADTDGRIMRLAFQRILHVCPSACAFHSRLLENMLAMLAGKNLELQHQLELLSQKTIQARVLRYLESVALHQGREFSIPMNRQELADFLCVDRSALSRELAKLKRDGRIDYWKNMFKFYSKNPPH